MAQLDNKYYDYSRFKVFQPIVKYEDIQVGKTYHIPPTILYPRRDFIVEYKDSNSLRGKLMTENGMWMGSTIYRNELSVKFLVEKQKIV